MSDKEKLAALKKTRDEAIQAAETASFEYARECDAGRERERAFDIYENIRISKRVG